MRNDEEDAVGGEEIDRQTRGVDKTYSLRWWLHCTRSIAIVRRCRQENASSKPCERGYVAGFGGSTSNESIDSGLVHPRV